MGSFKTQQKSFGRQDPIPPEDLGVGGIPGTMSLESAAEVQSRSLSRTLTFEMLWPRIGCCVSTRYEVRRVKGGWDTRSQPPSQKFLILSKLPWPGTMPD